MPRIAEETIQRVVEANDIVEVIGTDYFPLRRAGTTYRALCPFHREKTPSFHVNAQRQSYKCFGCGAGGDVIRFVREYEHLDFVEAVRKLARRAGIVIVEEEGDPEDGRRYEVRKRLVAMHVEAATWFHHNLLKSKDAQVARDYLKSRGIGSEVAKSWQLGFAPPSWDALLDFLREKKFSVEEIAQSGLASSREEGAATEAKQRPRLENFYARFRGRIMFPICNDFGEVIAFSGRVLDPEAKGAKYLNSPETPIFVKGKVLFGLHKAKRAMIDTKTAIVCEGQLDLISTFESGVQNIIASQGTAFTIEQARVLKRFVETVVLCFDSDRAGQEAVTKCLPSLLEHGLQVKVARLPQGEDPDSLIRSRGPAAFRDVVDGAKDFFDHALSILEERGTLDDPVGKAAAARRLGPYVALLKDKVLYDATAKKICARLAIPETAFAENIKAAPQFSSEPAEQKPQIVPVALSEGVRQLCRLALLNPEARAWLAGQETPQPQELGEGGGFLARILASALALEDPAPRAAFAASLSAAEELTLSAVDLDRPPENGLILTQNLWFGLAAALFRTQRDAAAAQLRQTGLSAEERVRLQTLVGEASKQILDLQSRVNEA